jgi:signal transduction histidine kinase
MGAVNEQQHSFLRTIRHSISRMDQLIQDLTDISRIETGKLHVRLAPMSFAPVVSEAVQITQAAFAEKEIELHVSLPADLPLVMGDQRRLIQVMTNLLSNACKYSPAGSHVYITVTAHLEQGNGRQAGLLTCEVRDTGYGIAEADQERLFTKFFRSADENIRQSSGTGLGLSITKGIIDLHDGEIHCESEVGKGTSFIFTIPLSG